MATFWAARPWWIRFLLLVLACPQPGFAPETECSLTPRTGTSIFELLVELPVASDNDATLCMNYSIKINTWKFRVGCPDGHCILVDGYCSYEVTALPMLSHIMQSFILLLQGNSYDISANVSIGYCYRHNGGGEERSSSNGNVSSSGRGSNDGSGCDSDDGSGCDSDDGSGCDSDDGSGCDSNDGSGGGSDDGSRRGSNDGSESGSGNIDHDPKSPSLPMVIIGIILAILAGIVVAVILVPIIKKNIQSHPPPIQPDLALQSGGQCLDKEEPKKECYDNIVLANMTSLLRSVDEDPREPSSDINVVSSPPTNFNAVSEPPKAAENGSAQSIVAEDTGPTSSTDCCFMFVGERCNGLYQVHHHGSSNISYKLPCASGSSTEVGTEV